jgi:hypothetical protein
MVWANLADINSVDMQDLREYMSRPVDSVLELVGQREGDFVIYGASGKFMRDVTLMILRSISETGTTNRTVHLVSSLREKPDFAELIEPYSDLIVDHRVDLLEARASDLAGVPTDAPSVLYGAGYKFFNPEEETLEEYILKVNRFGEEIPLMVFGHHQEGDVVIMGSYNGLKPSHFNQPATEAAELEPEPDIEPLTDCVPCP